jgi:thiamine biosynthesis lipoprotein
MHRRTFAAMGTMVDVLLPVDRRDAISPVRELFTDWEAKLSRFVPESQLSRLNARAGDAVEVDQVVFDVVDAAVDAGHATGGLFDPTLLRQLVRLGYAESFTRLPRAPGPACGSPSSGDWRQIELDASSRTVRLPVGCTLDLGGIAKGMAVDAALDVLRERGVPSALVSAGGDLAVLGLPLEGRAWHVLVGENSLGETVDLTRGALATSGVARRSWMQGGVARHHLLDPRTGEPAESDLYEVTVAAATCRMAEVAATASFVLGADRAADFVAAHRLAALFTRRDGHRVPVGSWPSSLRPAA